MLQNRLAYFNILFVMAYLLVHLRSGNFVSSSGGLAIIVFNWLVLKSYETEKYTWAWWHFLIGGWMLYFVGTLLYGTVNVILPAIEYQYADNSTLTFIVMSIVLSVASVWQLVLYFKKHLAERKNLG